MDSIRNSTEILKRIADCLCRECEAWVSNIQALHKAKLDEEATLRKEQERLEKQERKKAEREAEKQRKAAEKREQAARKETQDNGRDGGDADGGGPDADNGEDGKAARKKRKTHGENELSEDDPTILQNFPKFVCGAFAQAADVSSFVALIASQPNMSAVAKLKKGIIKKVMQAGLHLFF